MTDHLPDLEIVGKLLQDEIADGIRKAIISGVLHPGERLIEIEFAKRFGVSRAPLREAIRQLTADGLLVNIPRKGTFVVELSEKDIREIYTLRLALESIAVQILSETATAEQLSALGELVSEMKRALDRDERWTIIILDMRFHEMLCRFSNHSRLFTAWSRTADQLRTFFAAADRLLADQQIIERHSDLLAAIASGDRERASATLQDHISHAAELVLGNLSLFTGNGVNGASDERPHPNRNR